MAEIGPDFQLIFDSVDNDRSGRISSAELKDAMARTGEMVSIEGCDLLVGLFDNGTGSVDIQGFAKLVQLHVTWKSVFAQFDKDHSGLIDASEMKNALKTIFKGKVNLINQNPNPSQKTKVKFDKTYIEHLLAKFGTAPGAASTGAPGIFGEVTSQGLSGSSKNKNRLGLNEEQFLLACAYIQKNPPMKESSKTDKKSKK